MRLCMQSYVLELLAHACALVMHAYIVNSVVWQDVIDGLYEKKFNFTFANVAIIVIAVIFIDVIFPR